eukprot:gene812-136_t
MTEKETKPWEPKHNWGQTVLKPRNEGEDLRVQQVELKRRDRNLEYQAENAKKLKMAKDAKTGRVKLNHITAEKLVKRNLTAKRSKNSMDLKKNRKKQKKLKQRKADSKTIVVVRNAYGDECKTVRSKLKKFGLKNYNDLVFIPNTEENIKTLNFCENQVYWGFPNQSLVSNLLQKDAMVKNPKKKDEWIALSDNQLVEDHLGHLGILCTEDIANILLNGPVEKLADVKNVLKTFSVEDTRCAGKKSRDEKCTRGFQSFKMNEILKGLQLAWECRRPGVSCGVFEWS